MTKPEQGSPDTRVRREPERGRYDRETIDAVLDAGIVCHLGWIYNEHPVVIPTLYSRVGDNLLFHGSAAGRTPRGLASGTAVCLEVTLLDGLVLARSIFNHSINYRSVVVYGTASAVEDEEGKLNALKAFSERLLPGRWADARPPNTKELRATSILRLPLEAVSGKVRSGGPNDDEADLSHPAWAGVVPLDVVRGVPVPAPDLEWSAGAPPYLSQGPPTAASG